MGLIKAAINSVRSTMADQWLEYIYCDALPPEVLMRKGQKRVGKGSSNTKGSDNIITQGSHIAVNEGQFLLVVDDGKVVDFTDEAGVYTFDKSTEPSLFCGGFGKGLYQSFNLVGKRITFGGDTGHDQRVYYINKKLVTGNKFGTKAPVPFRDSEWMITVNIRCFGTYVFKVVDPLLFYTNLCGNAAFEYRASDIEEQFKSDLIGALQTALNKVAMQKVSYDMLPGATDQMTQAVREVLKTEWEDKVGINVDRVVIESVTPTEEDSKKIQQLQETRVYQNSDFANAAMRRAQADMVEGMGQGMSKGNAGGNAVSDAFGMMGVAMMGNMMGAGNPISTTGAQQRIYTQQDNNAQQNAGANMWQCSCGGKNSGKFCMECGKPKPDDAGNQAEAAPSNTEWECSCSAKNSGKFCTECGKPKPVIRRYKCDKCGWTPADPEKPPKFCPECGDIFNDNDVVE